MNSGEEFDKGTGQDIAQPYRAGSGEMPGAAADAAILMLARDAAAQSAPRNAAESDSIGHGRAGAVARMSTMRRWRAPLGLAASLVLVVGIVSRVQLEEEMGTAPGVVPVAPQPVIPSAPAEPPAPGSAASRAGPATATGAAQPAAPVEAKKLASAAVDPSSNVVGAPGQSVSPQVADSAPANAPASASAMTPATTPSATTARPEDALERKKERKTDVVTDIPVPFPLQGRRPAGAIEGVVKPERDARAKASAESALPAKSTGLPNESTPVPVREDDAVNRPPARQPAESRAAAMPAPAAAVAPMALSEQAEATLTPEQWLRRIIEARRAGRHEEADASLVRLVAKHPQLLIPTEARRN